MNNEYSTCRAPLSRNSAPSDRTIAQLIDDDFQDVGIVSDLEMTAEEMGRIKREHWKIENSCHHVLDTTMREDRSPAKKSKNNLALIRKFAYNILRMIVNEQPVRTTIADLKEILSDEPERIKNYIFEG